ncbi:diguanylate cyclase [Denitratimonas sp. CY0512]|uniref:sensor domain-containing diguanylate cyclase n=1 Tax=Denitratimonas sp. CY0512 TaxID=3131940 RepID=UPI003098ED5E
MIARRTLPLVPSTRLRRLPGAGFALWLMVMCLAAPALARASVPAPVWLDDDSAALNLDAHTAIARDAAHRLDAATVRQLALDGELPLRNDNARGLGYTRDTVWLYFALENTTPQPLQRVLIIHYPLLDHIRLHRFDDGIAAAVRETGDRLPFSSRDLPLLHPNLLLDLAPGARAEFVLQVRSESTMLVPLSLAPTTDLVLERLKPRVVLGLYYGIFLALGLYHLFLYLSVRDSAFLWYSIYTASYGLMLLCFNGLAFAYLWPDHPDWGNLAVPVLIGAAQMSIFQFSRRFLALAEHAPRQDRLLRHLLLATLALLLMLPLTSYGTVIRLQTLLALFGAAAVLGVALLNLKNNPPARFFLLAWVSLLAGTAAYAAMILGWLPRTLLTEYGIQIGSALEVLLLAFAMAYRIKLLTRQNQVIAQQARDELERRVQQRTAELDNALQALEQANARLRDFSRRDGLTGLYNRRHLDERLVAACNAPQRMQGAIALLMIDVDHFKSINDLHGHSAGDDCLRGISQRLDALLRDLPAALLARYGGEEFAILLTDSTSESAVELAQRIRSAMAASPIECEHQPIPVTVSIGVHIVPPGVPCTAADLLRQADARLYRAKRAGRDRVDVSTVL